MSQITLQGKQQALMRVAASRVAVLDAVVATQQHAGSCVRALPISPSTIFKIGAVLGAAATVTGTLAGFRRRRIAAEKKAAAKSSSTGPLWQLALQLATPVLLPMLQRMLQKVVPDAASTGRNSVF